MLKNPLKEIANKCQELL